jgi:lipopolysaccharide export system permease protein
VRQGFDRSTVTFSLASFGTSRTPEELFKTNRMMLNIGQLHKATDSMQRQLGVERVAVPRQMNAYYTFLRVDTTGRAANAKVAAWQVPAARLAAPTPAILQQAANRARNLRSFAGSTSERLYGMAKDSALFRIEVYRKYSQSVAVLLMFLIGAPLGAIIKKGGLGVPILVSILFFIIYYVVSIMGEKYGREFVMPVALGMWLSNLVLLPAGLFFMYQAYHDSGLFELDFWRRLSQRLRLPGWLRLAAPAGGTGGA